MNYFIDLFSPETAKAFNQSPKDISGFRISRKTYVENQKINPGDKFICYVTRLMRFIGILEIKSKYFIDNSPIFTNENDPFVLRFNVEPLVWLPLEKAIPIHSDIIWNSLSSTKNLDKGIQGFVYKARLVSSPFLWPKKDGVYLEKVLLNQAKILADYPFSDEDLNRLKAHKIRISDKKEVSVSVPEDSEEIQEVETKQEVLSEKRESLKVQTKLAEIGEKLGMKIWLPRNDRAKILKDWEPKDNTLLDELPFSFDEVTIKTIKNIDVLWIKGRAIIRAFEVEDTTSIYSGILRMADLLSLLPTIQIKIHLVAPENRRNEVFKQISRPVFSVMEIGPLSELCSYISYDSVYKLSKEKQLENMKDTIIDEFSEFSEE